MDAGLGQQKLRLASVLGKSEVSVRSVDQELPLSPHRLTEWRQKLHHVFWLVSHAFAQDLFRNLN